MRNKREPPRKRSTWAVVIDRDVVEQTARIVGPASGAQAALDRAETMADPVFVKRIGHPALIVVERSALEPAP